jgi:hypothetical protein
MKCTLKQINLNATKRSAAGKTFTGVEVTYQGEPYKGVEKEPTTRFLFSDNPVARALPDYKVGDFVEIKFDSDKFKTPLSIGRAEAYSPSAPKAAAATSATGPAKWGQQDPDTQKRIARSVAIKEATVLVVEMMKQGAFAASKTKSYEFLAQQILEVAKIYEPYVNATDQADDVVKPELTEEDFAQDGFDD